MRFKPRPIADEEPIPVTIIISKSRYSKLENIAKPMSLDVPQLLDQFLVWAIDGKVFAPGKRTKRATGIKPKEPKI